MQDPQERIERDSELLSKIITDDETWAYGYDPETKQQPSQGKSPSTARPKKARQVCSNVSSWLVFFDVHGIVQYEFVIQGQIVKHLYCVDTLQRLPDPPEQ
jgi:hypothetical protein